MARASGGVLGNFKGKLGKVSARIVEGDTILCARPASFKASNAPKNVEVRKKFSVTVAFASNVTRLQTLHDIWKLNKGPKMSAFNTITKENFALSSAQAPTLNNIITPGGFGSPVTAAAIAAGKLTGTLAAINSVAILSANETDLSIDAIVCLSDPKADGDPFYKLIPLSKEVAGFNFSQVYNLEIDLNVVDAPEIAKYNQKMIYLAVATKSADGKLVQYSRSYSVLSN
jgi:hypothetical protein